MAVVALAPLIARFLVAWETYEEAFFDPADVAEIDYAFAEVTAGRR